MQGNIKQINGTFPVTHSQAVYVNEHDTLDEYIEARKIVSIKDFGAKGDGIADDSLAIQGALNSLRETGGEVFFPTGTYLINNPIIFYSNMRLNFAKNATILRGKSDLNILFLAYADDVTGGYDGIHHTEIIGATFDLNENFNTHGGAIAFIHANNLNIRNCTFRNMAGTWHYIECNGSTNIFIENNIFEKVRTTSFSAELIQIDGSQDNAVYPWVGLKDNTVCTDITIRNNFFEGNGFSPAIGNHTNMAHTNVYIYNNLFKNFYTDVDSDRAGHRGVINFVNLQKNTLIFDNQFINFTKAIISFGKNTDTMVYNNVFIGNKYALQAGCTFTNNLLEQPDGTLKFIASGTV